MSISQLSFSTTITTTVTIITATNNSIFFFILIPGISIFNFIFIVDLCVYAYVFVFIIILLNDTTRSQPVEYFYDPSNYILPQSIKFYIYETQILVVNDKSTRNTNSGKQINGKQILLNGKH